MYIIFFFLYIYPPDTQESDGNTNTYGKQLLRPVSRNVKILLCDLNFYLVFFSVIEL